MSGLVVETILVFVAFAAAVAIVEFLLVALRLVVVHLVDVHVVDAFVDVFVFVRVVLVHLVAHVFVRVRVPL